jgi:hypothetical protein
MKTSHTLRLLALAVALAPCALPAARAESKNPVVGFVSYSSSFEAFFNPRLLRGAKVSEVLLTLGEPDARVLPDLWVYWNCQTNRDDLNARGLDTLVVAFAEGRVNALKIVPHASLEPYLARVTPGRDPALALAAK